MRRRDIITIDKIIGECRELLALKEGYTLVSFLDEERTKRAISMTLINIGELVKALTNETREQYSSVPWKLIAGLRDIAAHHYALMTMEDIWETVKSDVPVFLNNLLEIQKEAQQTADDSSV
jgi:uncharacterized protein with HEPN domain